MSGFDQLGRELESAAARGRARSWSSRVRGAGGTVAIGVALATVVVIAVGAVVLLHGRGASRPAAAAPSTQGAPGAQVAAWQRALTCARGKAPGVVSSRDMTNDSPGPKLLAAVAVLRGPWTPADDAPAGTCGVANGTALLSYKMDIRFVRYVGPGVHGGTVFLVPGTLMAPQLPAALLKKNPKLRKVLGPFSHQPVACLITIGGKSPAAQGCTLLAEIERPAGITIAPPIKIPAPSPAILGKVCEQMRKAIARGKASGKNKFIPSSKAPCPRAVPPALRAIHLPPQVISGVVRDGITSLEVETQSGKRLLSVPIHDNVYAFQTGGAVSGLLKLVFRNAAGRVVQTTPTGTGKVRAVLGVAGQGVANIPLISSPKATVTGTVTPLASGPAKAVTGTVTPLAAPPKPHPARRSSSG